jgi:hypothetical protein
MINQTRKCSDLLEFYYKQVLLYLKIKFLSDEIMFSLRSHVRTEKVSRKQFLFIPETKHLKVFGVSHS